MIKRRKVDPAVMTLLMEYHAYHGDSNVRYAGEIDMPHGAVLYLMRFENEQGEKYSSLDYIMHGAAGAYATEMWSAERADEQKIIRLAKGENEDGR